LCQITHDPSIAEQRANVAIGQHEIEVISSVGLMDNPELTLKIRGLTLHVRGTITTNTAGLTEANGRVDEP